MLALAPKMSLKVQGFHVLPMPYFGVDCAADCLPVSGLVDEQRMLRAGSRANPGRHGHPPPPFTTRLPIFCFHQSVIQIQMCGPGRSTVRCVTPPSSVRRTRSLRRKAVSLCSYSVASTTANGSSSSSSRTTLVVRATPPSVFMNHAVDNQRGQQGAICTLDELVPGGRHL